MLNCLNTFVSIISMLLKLTIRKFHLDHLQWEKCPRVIKMKRNLSLVAPSTKISHHVQSSHPFILSNTQKYSPRLVYLSLLYILSLFMTKEKGL